MATLRAIRQRVAHVDKAVRAPAARQRPPAPIAIATAMPLCHALDRTMPRASAIEGVSQMRFGTSILIGGLAVISACASGGNEIVSSGARYAPPDASLEDYRLGIDDRVRMTVFSQPEVSGEFAVGADGALALPLIGRVPALSKTVSEVAAEAQRLFGDGYLRDPRVSMEVITFRPFFIMGEVTQPGPYPYTVGLTALNSIAVARGYTPRSDRAVVGIRRSGEAEEKIYKVTPELRIYPGDTVRVQERFF
ncbi:polysaccharide biosynthesis/export family protein [Sphingomonas arantia]|uniref:Polysaccharide biosynthesis/export family protein n=1 Tax=Sphingomonas arantia TaxID=1460676 RepID=A0ABW4TSC0_9SPHN